MPGLLHGTSALYGGGPAQPHPAAGAGSRPVPRPGRGGQGPLYGLPAGGGGLYPPPEPVLLSAGLSGGFAGLSQLGLGGRLDPQVQGQIRGLPQVKGGVQEADHGKGPGGRVRRGGTGPGQAAGQHGQVQGIRRRGQDTGGLLRPRGPQLPAGHMPLFVGGEEGKAGGGLHHLGAVGGQGADDRTSGTGVEKEAPGGQQALLEVKIGGGSGGTFLNGERLSLEFC